MRAEAGAAPPPPTCLFGAGQGPLLGGSQYQPRLIPATTQSCLARGTKRRSWRCPHPHLPRHAHAYDPDPDKATVHSQIPIHEAVVSPL